MSGFKKFEGVLRAHPRVFLFRFALLLLVAPAVAQIGTDDASLQARLRDVPLLDYRAEELRVEPPLQGISAIAPAKNGLIFVLHRPAAGDPVVVVNSAGRRIRSWGAGLYRIPHGIKLDPAGNVWTVDAGSSTILKFSPKGEKLLAIQLGGIPDPRREFCGATDIAFDSGGGSFVVDGYCNGRVVEFDRLGRRVAEWGRKGTGPGEFDVVHGVAFGSDGFLYIADRENGRLQWFTPQGDFRGQWVFGGQFYNVCFGPDGSLWGSTHPKGAPLEAEFHVVKIDRATGRLLGRLPIRSHLLALGDDGAVYPATRSNQLVVFRPRR